MSMLKADIIPRKGGCTSIFDPSPIRRPPLSLQTEWARAYLNYSHYRQRNQFLGFTKFKIVSDERKGAAELIRMLFCYAGIYFEDLYLTHLDCQSLIAKMPFGRLPVLWMDDNVYAEPMAICRLLAKHMQLMGSKDEEMFVVETVLQQIDDLKETNILQKAFLEVQGYPHEGHFETIHSKILPHTFQTWSKIISETNGPFVLESGLSIADMAIFDFLDQYTKYLNLQPLIDVYPALITLMSAVRYHRQLSVNYFKQGKAQKKHT